jgi:hypothetical protein
MRWGSDQIDRPQNRKLVYRKGSGVDAVQKIKTFARAEHRISITGLSYALLFYRLRFGHKKGRGS